MEWFGWYVLGLGVAFLVLTVFAWGLPAEERATGKNYSAAWE